MFLLCVSITTLKIATFGKIPKVAQKPIYFSY